MIDFIHGPYRAPKQRNPWKIWAIIGWACYFFVLVWHILVVLWLTS